MKNTQSPYAVVHAPFGSCRAIVLDRFDTSEEASAYIESIRKHDPVGVFQGDYGIDGPELEKP